MRLKDWLVIKGYASAQKRHWRN